MSHMVLQIWTVKIIDAAAAAVAALLGKARKLPLLICQLCTKYHDNMTLCMQRFRCQTA